MVNLALNDVLAPASGVISREADKELVVVLPEQGKFLVLNGTGAVAFRLMDGQCTLEEMAAALGERYRIPFDRARDDVLAFATRLLERGAVYLTEG